MPSITFISNPTVGQEYTAENGQVYTWTGNKWQSNATTGSTGLANLPANSAGYLTNDGSGNLVWGAGDGTFSGDYNDLNNKPSIPEATSDLTNDSGFITSDVTQSIVPTVDNAVDLGSATNRFRHLFVAPGTIYLGDIKISNLNGKVDAKKVVNPGEENEYEDETDGDAFSPLRGGGASALDALTDVDISSLTNGQVLVWDNNDEKWKNQTLSGGGGVSFSGNYNDLTNTPFIPTSLSDLGITAGSDGQVLTLNSSLTPVWTTPSGGSGSGASNEITNTDGTNTYSVSVSTTGIVTMTTARGTLEFGAQPEEGAPQHLHIMRPAGQEGATDLYFGDDYNYFKLPGNYGAGTLGVEIGAQDGGMGGQSVWRFGTDGNIHLPAGGNIHDSNGNALLGGGSGAGGFTKAVVAGQNDILAEESGNELTLVAGDGIAITTNDSDGTITIAAASNATPQYGYFTELTEQSSSNSVNGGAVVMDSDGNSYVGYSYYDNNINNDVSGIMKISNTGEQQWAVNIASQNGDARNPEIASLELVDINGTTSLVALGYYYNNDTNKDVAFIYYINPTNGSINDSLDNAELVAPGGMNVKDGVAGYDGSNPYVVVVGETYEQTVTKTLTPLAGSTTDKLFVSWADFAASGVSNGESLYYVDGPNQYGVTMNAIGVSANTPGYSGNSWDGISISVSVNEAGNYTVSRVNGWGYLVNSWDVPVSLIVPGADLGGVTGVNDMTFDFDRTVFNNDSNNIQAAISNIQGTPVTGVYCQGWGGYDWSTQIGNALTFNYQLNNQAYIGRFGQSGGWTKNFGGGSYDRLYSVVVDGDLNTYAVGYVWNGSRGSLVAKYDYEGGPVWAVYIDPSDNTGNGLMSVDLLNDGNLITVDEDGVVTKLDSSNGDIIWQVKADNGPSWDGDFRGTATPDGDYIITNYEDNDYTQYVMRISGSDGSSVWNKRITRTYGGDNGEINADDNTQYIDCNATNLTIGGRTYPPNGDSTGIVYSFPINGENTNGTYSQYVITSESMNWTTKSTTSIAASVTNTDISVTPNETTPTSSASIISANITTMGGEPAGEPTVISWTNPNGNTWRIEEYNGGAAVQFWSNDNYSAKWFDIANHTSGSNDFRGAIIQYHAFVQNRGAIIGTIHLGNDYTQESATHTEHMSGHQDLQYATFWDCNNERGQLFFKMTNNQNWEAMIQWTAKIFYGSENNC